MRTLFSKVLIGFALLAAGCDMSTPAKPPEKGNQANPRWIVDNGGAVNAAYYVSRAKLPANTELRIEVVARGELANVQLVDKESGQNIQSWPHESMIEGQILSHVFEKPLQPYLSVGGSNYWCLAEHISDDADVDIMKFERGWTLRVRIVKPKL